MCLFYTITIRLSYKCLRLIFKADYLIILISANLLLIMDICRVNISIEWRLTFVNLCEKLGVLKFICSEGHYLYCMLWILIIIYLILILNLYL